MLVETMYKEVQRTPSQPRRVREPCFTLVKALGSHNCHLDTTPKQPRKSNSMRRSATAVELKTSQTLTYTHDSTKDKRSLSGS